MYYFVKYIVPLLFMVWILTAPAISDWWTVVPLLIMFG